MKRETFLWVLLTLALILTFAPPTIEFFRSRGAPNYCNGENSCVAQGCSLDPTNQPCDRNRTTQKSILSSDPDWGDMLGGQTVEVCADQNGNMMDTDTCQNCSVCGLIVPGSGNLGNGLCVPLTNKGCMKNAPSGQLLSYLNDNPSNLSCCGN